MHVSNSREPQSQFKPRSCMYTGGWHIQAPTLGRHGWLIVHLHQMKCAIRAWRGDGHISVLKSVFSQHCWLLWIPGKVVILTKLWKLSLNLWVLSKNHAPKLNLGWDVLGPLGNSLQMQALEHFSLTSRSSCSRPTGLQKGKETKKYLSVCPRSIILCPFSPLSTFGISPRSGFSQLTSTALILPSPNPDCHLSVSCTPAVLFHTHQLLPLKF